ncbi:hypothetical protein [Neokomagataea anthophila]|uniref:Uncharacterized protein n=1 Tax=Neokomagataea anthophila TaxID=2826925 RepID=A0ABS5E998_9PROT|nr:hypothetical protein [Neokomagataea anthophila]MBR0560485.1 hypothetical protein [Neokomagataea anthophila]
MNTSIPLNPTETRLRAVLVHLCTSLTALGVQKVDVTYTALQGNFLDAEVTLAPVPSCTPMMPVSADNAALVHVHPVVMTLLKMVLAQQEPSFATDTQHATGTMSLHVTTQNLNVEHYRRHITPRPASWRD